MFRQTTTIVVGAGASCEIGLPAGDQLKKQIADLFAMTDENIYGHKNQTMIEAIKDRPGQRNHVYVRKDVPDYDGQIVAFRGTARRIRRGLPLALSIDNFLHANQADAKRQNHQAVFIETNWELGLVGRAPSPGFASRRRVAGHLRFVHCASRPPCTWRRGEPYSRICAMVIDIRNQRT